LDELLQQTKNAPARHPANLKVLIDTHRDKIAGDIAGPVGPQAWEYISNMKYIYVKMNYQYFF